MKLKQKRIGFVMTGSFCTFRKSIEQLKNIIEEDTEVLPVMSFNAYNLDTKFGKAKDFIEEIEQITRKRSNPYNSRGRTNWTKIYDRYNDYNTSHRKYNC